MSLPIFTILLIQIEVNCIVQKIFDSTSLFLLHVYTVFKMKFGQVIKIENYFTAFPLNGFHFYAKNNLYIKMIYKRKNAVIISILYLLCQSHGINGKFFDRFGRKFPFFLSHFGLSFFTSFFINSVYCSSFTVFRYVNFNLNILFICSANEVKFSRQFKIFFLLMFLYSFDINNDEK